jgi:hypothetical protein
MIDAISRIDHNQTFPKRSALILTHCHPPAALRNDDAFGCPNASYGAKRIAGGAVPNTKQQVYRTELNAYRTQQAVHQGLGLNTGLRPSGASQDVLDQRVADGAQRSTDAWCNSGGNC